MGLINDFCSRILLHGTSRMLGESTALVLAVGLTAGCSSRPTVPPPDPAPAPQAENATVEGPSTVVIAGEVSSTSSADGHTHVRLAPLPGLQEGDVIHLLAHERVVATALITEVDIIGSTALVTGLTDRTRVVAVGDIAARLKPEDILPSLTAEPPRVAEVAVAVPVVVPVAVAVAVAVPVAVAPTVTPTTVSTPLEHPPVGVEIAAATAVHETTPQVVQTSVPTPAATTESLPPEVRARLTAERAYFELATRVLRLPIASPELVELQNRLRTELAGLELLP